MDIETTNGQTETIEPADRSLPFPESWWGRVWYALYITVIPIFAFESTTLIKPEWQSGQFTDYLVLFLFPEASALFFLLMGYSVVCYLLIMLSPDQYARYFFVRLGIYTAVVLALQYSILAALYLFNESPNPVIPLLWVFPLLFLPAYRWAARKWGGQMVRIALGALSLAVLLIGGLLAGSLSSVLLVPVMLLTMAAPFWCFLIAMAAALWLLRTYETRLVPASGLGLTAWLGAYLIAWRFDILKMYELYAQLPPTPPPDCYIATAAARGHAGFVGARTVRCADGNKLHVNAQLQWFKCAELALLALAPGLHKRLRAVYDVVGMHLARNIRSPFTADLAYLLLKPAEWLATCLLRLVIPDMDSIAKKMYIER